jgi:hypothetical protein
LEVFFIEFSRAKKELEGQGGHFVGKDPRGVGIVSDADGMLVRLEHIGIRFIHIYIFFYDFSEQSCVILFLFFTIIDIDIKLPWKQLS